MLPSDLHMCVMTFVLCNYTQNKNKSAKNSQKIQVGWTYFFCFVWKVPREKDVGTEMGRRWTMKYQLFSVVEPSQAPAGQTGNA